MEKKHTKKAVALKIYKILVQQPRFKRRRPDLNRTKRQVQSKPHQTCVLMYNGWRKKSSH